MAARSVCTVGQVAFEFKPKVRESRETDKVVKANNTKKHQKQFFELQTKRDYDKQRALLAKHFDPNFHYDQNGATSRPPAPGNVACGRSSPRGHASVR